jgi:hypothetical protein
MNKSPRPGLKLLSLRTGVIRGCSPTRARPSDQYLQGTPASDHHSKLRPSSFTIEAPSSYPKPFLNEISSCSQSPSYSIRRTPPQISRSVCLTFVATLAVHPENLPHNYTLVWELEACNMLCLDVSPLLNSS